MPIIVGSQTFFVELRETDIVKIKLGGLGRHRRIEVYGFDSTIDDICSVKIQTPLPFGIHRFWLTNHIEVKLGDIIVDINMDAEVHPFVIDTGNIRRRDTSCMKSAMARGGGHIRTITSHV